MRARTCPGRAWLAALVAILPACGYSMRSLAPEGARSVAVEVIENPTFRRDFEFQLTEDIKSAILSRTDLRIVERNRADLLLTGKLLRLREQVLVEDRVDNIVESSIVVTAEFVVRDLRTGEERGRRRLTDSAEFLTGRGENIETATAESFEDLAEKVIYALLEEPF